MSAPVSVILAAGKSTRMKSALPKVLHEICGRPMIEYVLDASRAAGVRRQVVIVGHEAEQVKQTLSHHTDVEFALQSEQKGTGHAVMMCRDNLAKHDGPVLILTGDAPLMRPESFTALLVDFHEQHAACVIGTSETENNHGLGRIVRSDGGEFLRIVEQKDATPEEAAIREINVGCYVFDCQALFAALNEIRPNNKQGEYYLTDCAAILKAQGKRVVASQKLDIAEALGVNTRAQLVDIHRVFQSRCFEQLMAEGVTIVEPSQTYIDPRAAIGPDTVIEPFTTITGQAVIGRGCRIGPHAVVSGDTRLADGEIVRPFQQV
ncbi:MAG: NTP transferase domain-containing protein [Planctomycetales bacterium]|nr:NTP transferase domain-containing protein [Planctomycetales bacterium]